MFWEQCSPHTVILTITSTPTLTLNQTLTLMNECTNDWSLSLNAQNSVNCAYVDFSKAFDSVVHSKLCCKLYTPLVFKVNR